MRSQHAPGIRRTAHESAEAVILHEHPDHNAIEALIVGTDTILERTDGHPP